MLEKGLKNVGEALYKAQITEDHPDFELSDARIKSMKLVGLISGCTPPQILLVCRESFGVAAKLFQPAFACLGSLPQTYFNFSTDTLYICHESFNNGNSRMSDILIDLCNGFQGLDCLHDLEKVKYLAIRVEEDDLADYDIPTSNEDQLARALLYIVDMFRALKTVTLVLDRYASPHEEVFL